MALTQEQVVGAAVDLLAEVGLEALTLRRLATELGVSAPTLYWHVRNKRKLLDHIAEALVEVAGRPPPPRPGRPGGTGWPSGPAAVPGPDVPPRRRAGGGRQPSDRGLHARDRGGAGQPHRRGLLARRRPRPSRRSATSSSARRSSTTPSATRDPDPERDARLLLQAGDLPNLRAAIAGLEGPGPSADDAGFEYGLALLISGARAHHAQLAGAGATA